MLDSIDIVEDSGNELVVGFDGTTENNKAHGHMTGQGGNNPKMKRLFFGVNNKELKDIKNKFADRLKEEKPVAKPETKSALDLLEALGTTRATNRQIVTELFGDLFNGN